MLKNVSQSTYSYFFSKIFNPSLNKEKLILLSSLVSVSAFGFFYFKRHSSIGYETISIYAVNDFPLVKRGDDLPKLICSSIKTSNLSLQDRDIVVVAQKPVSISEGNIVDLESISPTAKARQLAELSGREPELCQLFLNESTKILGVKGPMVVTEHRLGFDCTNAGIDKSNVAHFSERKVSLLPKNPDESAKKIRCYIQDKLNKNVAVIIIDTFGKPDREGGTGAAIGLAGISALVKEEEIDLYGNKRKSTTCLVDEVASAASAVMGKTKKIPLVVLRGIPYPEPIEEPSIRDLLVDKDKFPLRQFE